mmetsp:Transcript_42014/g.75205  ORF Transcript_42014/g.75205 Transcript_42014/m.75205 type:complete len:81 (+) Transcript_42014:20-262(+)
MCACGYAGISVAPNLSLPPIASPMVLAPPTWEELLRPQERTAGRQRAAALCEHWSWSPVFCEAEGLQGVVEREHRCHRPS